MSSVTTPALGCPVLCPAAIHREFVAVCNYSSEARQAASSSLFQIKLKIAAVVGEGLLRFPHLLVPYVSWQADALPPYLPPTYLVAENNTGKFVVQIRFTDSFSISLTFEIIDLFPKLSVHSPIETLVCMGNGS